MVVNRNVLLNYDFLNQSAETPTTPNGEVRVGDIYIDQEKQNNELELLVIVGKIILECLSIELLLKQVVFVCQSIEIEPRLDNSTMC